MRPRKMLVHHHPLFPLFRKHMRAPPVDLVRFLHPGPAGTPSPAIRYAANRTA
jgi:hypothetical protein